MWKTGNNWQMFWSFEINFSISNPYDVEEEQLGKERAEYAKFLLKNLSNELTSVFGESFSKRQLERYRQFYRLYPIASAVRTQFSWTHYK